MSNAPVRQMIISVALFAAITFGGWHAVGFLTDQQDLRLLLAILTAFLIVLVLAKFGTIRHRRFLTRLIESQGSTIVEFHRLRGFMSPSKLLLWRDWTAYEVDAISPSGKATHYFVFLTGVAFCLFALDAELTTRDDYIWSSGKESASESS